MKHTTKLIGIIAAVILVLAISTGAAVADGNIANETLPYVETEQYQQDIDYWYNYHIQDRATGYEATLRQELDALLHSGTLSASERNEAILIKLGWDFRLENFMDETKRTIDEKTGAVTYNLGIGNWWAKLFGNGTKEETLPATQAEGDALYKIYSENYSEWIKVLKGEY